MKKFRFRFESVLEMRKRLENESLKNLAESQRFLQEQIERKNFYKKELDKSLERREALGSVSVFISAYHSEEYYITGVKQRIYQSEQAVFRANKNVEKFTKKYLNAKKQRRIMEVIYEHDYA